MNQFGFLSFKLFDISLMYGIINFAEGKGREFILKKQEHLPPGYVIKMSKYIF